MLFARQFDSWRLAALAAALACCASGAPAQTQNDFFDPAVLHEIRLDMNPSDWSRLKSTFQDNTYYDCDFHWFFQGRDIVSSNIAIRSRGRGSRSPVKPGLRVDFDRNDPVQQFLGLGQVVLRNNTQDPTMLKERLSMLFFQLMGLPAPRETHARFFVNNEYIGLYTIVEAIDKKFLTRNFRENDGYLYEYDWRESYNFEYRGSNPASYSPAPFRPETHERAPNPAPIEAMIRTMNQASDTDFSRAMAEFVDLKLFMSEVAIENFLGDQDGILGDFGLNNFYFYRFVGRNLSQFLAWDKSNAFAGDYDIFRHFDRNVLARRALAVPELRSHYLQVLSRAAVLAGGTGGWLEQEIDRQYSQVRTAAREDTNKQCQGSDGLLKPCSNEEFEAGVVGLRNFARGRGDSVRGQLAAAGLQIRAVNGASFVAGDLAPGSLISIFGESLANGTAGAAALPLPLELAGASVSINGVPAPLLFASPNQINLQIPWQTTAGTASIVTSRGGTAATPISVTIGPVSPGIFVVVHADGRPVTADNPAVAGEVLVVYANGLGAVSGSVTSGQGAPSNPPATTTQAPGVTIGGISAGVEFSGLTPGFVGLNQVNVRVPASFPTGPRTPLALTIGGQIAIPSLIATR